MIDKARQIDFFLSFYNAIVEYKLHGGSMKTLHGYTETLVSMKVEISSTENDETLPVVKVMDEFKRMLNSHAGEVYLNWTTPSYKQWKEGDEKFGTVGYNRYLGIAIGKYIRGLYA